MHLFMQYGPDNNNTTDIVLNAVKTGILITTLWLKVPAKHRKSNKLTRLLLSRPMIMMIQWCSSRAHNSVLHQCLWSSQLHRHKSCNCPVPGLILPIYCESLWRHTAWWPSGAWHLNNNNYYESSMSITCCCGEQLLHNVNFMPMITTGHKIATICTLKATQVNHHSRM